MAYPNISLNGTSIATLMVSNPGSGGVFDTGDTPRSIAGNLVDLGFPVKEKFGFTVKVGTTKSWLKGLKALPSFTFLDFEGDSYSVRMMSLSFNYIYCPDGYVEIAQFELEEV